ncbi:MAG: hypothetical protein AB1782_04885 [Cyanobacteriota bacterium]
MRRKGQNLIELAIILAIVVLAGILVLSLLGKNVNSILENSRQKASEYKPFKYSDVVVNAAGSGYKMPESIGGSPEEPKTECDNNYCVLDFGDFVLSDIPQNINEVIKTAGSSGGTEKIVALLDQISQQLEAKGDVQGAAEYKNLANLGHFLARMEEGSEKVATQCQNDVDPADCYKKRINVLNNLSLVEVPENLKEVLPEFSTSHYALSVKDNFFRIDKAMYYKVNEPDEFKKKTEYNPAYAYADLYSNIIENPKYSDELKGITKELTQTISDMSSDHFEKLSLVLQGVYGDNNFSYYQKYDLDTGEQSGGDIMKKVSTLTDISNPAVSISTDYNAVLICATGMNKDTGKQCH